MLDRLWLNITCALVRNQWKIEAKKKLLTLHYEYKLKSFPLQQNLVSEPKMFRIRQPCQKNTKTRMHSSRMRTGRTLTVFRCLVPGGGGGWVYPQRKWKSPPEKLETPKKLETPPKNWRPPWDQTRPPQDWLARNTHPTPPWTDRRLWKYYLGQNFVSAGDKRTITFWNMPQLILQPEGLFSQKTRFRNTTGVTFANPFLFCAPAGGRG